VSAGADAAPDVRSGERWSGERRVAVERRLAEEPYRCPWWARNPHLQTVWGALARRRLGPRAAFRREEVETPDGDRLVLHHAARSKVARLPGTDARRPLALLMHGLEGSVRSHYIGGQARSLGEHGFDVVVLEARSCSGEINRARRLYHSGETSDLAFIVELLIARGRTELYLSGVSLSANALLKWLGEMGDAVPKAVRAASAISPPFDLTQSGPAIDRALGGLYVRRFLRTLIPKALAKERQYPGCLDREAVRRSRTFAEFDTHATAALHGFHDALDYWQRSGCGQFLPGIRRPTLLVAAADDPFNPAASLPPGISRQNPMLFEAFPDRGGHVGFLTGKPWAPGSWAEERTVEFFALVAAW
jgi:hypothetical protein